MELEQADICVLSRHLPRARHTKCNAQRLCPVWPRHEHWLMFERCSALVFLSLSGDMPALWLSAVLASPLEAGGTKLAEAGMGRHGMVCEGSRRHGVPRAGPVELINCFCSALGISFNIHQPVMKETSELSLNIDGPGRLTAELGKLPPARTPPGRSKTRSL